MKGARVALAVLGLLVGAAAGAEPRCRTRVLLEPTTAWVGEQVVYRLQILRHHEVSKVRWAEDLAFPSFRVEWLPGQAPDPAIHDVGDHSLVFEERRALFPLRAGSLVIPPARLACTTPDGIVEAAVPPAVLEVRSLPARRGGQPDATGVVGPLRVVARLSRERLRLGQSLELWVALRGAGNLWDATPPFDAARDLPDADAYPRPETLERDAARRVELERSFEYELVPRRTGAFEVPALRVRYFDPERERFRIAKTPPLRFHVEPARHVAAAPSADARTAGARQTRLSRRLVSGLLLGGASLATVAGIGVAARRWRRRRRAPLRAAQPHLAAAETALARGDPTQATAALTRALRAGLEVRLPGASALAIEELGMRGGAAASVAALLEELERSRFAAPGRRPGTALDPERVRELLREL